ncbi:MAG: pyridoxamine 5'-phosphate oxidase family protein [Pseudomonadota bacterium]
MDNYNSVSSGREHETVNDPLVKIEQAIWQSLVRAGVDARHPWRWPVLSTVSQSAPETLRPPCVSGRILVLRKAQAKPSQLMFYTDKRSQKVQDIRKVPHVCFTFWDPKKMQQVRLAGDATIVEEGDLWEEHFNCLSKRSWGDYAADHPPGTVIERADPYVQDRKNDGTIINNVEKGELNDSLLTKKVRENFTLLVVKAKEIDWLHLRRSGHIRARIIYSVDSTSPVRRSFIEP